MSSSCTIVCNVQDCKYWSHVAHSGKIVRMDKINIAHG